MSTGQKVLALLGASYAINAALARYAPPHPIIAFVTAHTLMLWSVLLFSWATYSMVIWPRFFSPLRHMPTVPVSNVLNDLWS